ncbi:MAG: TatD family hydrolase [Armatimonadota bacterium]|nr:TatD family hydrolase [Armatimonadota bacterium]MCX7776475.1 TatD family hydrolase [Armatimonadota bacterium]MDW8024272.1 TatD family hydrolase [Armatimonadota bacterium]
MIDTHAHLNHPMFYSDFPEVIKRSSDLGLQAIINIGYDLHSSELAIKQALAFSGFIWASVGIHPHHASSFTKGIFERLYELAAHYSVVAIGESGLDFYRNLSPKDAQLSAFEAQIEIACELGKPLIVHMRNASEDTIRILNRYTNRLRGVVVHCFDGNEQLAMRLIEIGCHIGIAGNVTYKGAESLRCVARSIPIDRLLLETDSPYLAPVPHRGKRNEPSYLKHVAERIAVLREVTMDELIGATVRNAVNLFKLPIATQL